VQWPLLVCQQCHAFLLQACKRPPRHSRIQPFACLQRYAVLLQVRRRILRHFNADPADWQLAFTRSATGALKIVGETFPWSSGSMFRCAHRTAAALLASLLRVHADLHIVLTKKLSLEVC